MVLKLYVRIRQMLKVKQELELHCLIQYNFVGLYHAYFV